MFLISLKSIILIRDRIFRKLILISRFDRWIQMITQLSSSKEQIKRLENKIMEFYSFISFFQKTEKILKEIIVVS